MTKMSQSAREKLDSYCKVIVKLFIAASPKYVKAKIRYFLIKY